MRTGFSEDSSEPVPSIKKNGENRVSFRNYVLTCRREWNILKLTDLYGRESEKRWKNAQCADFKLTFTCKKPGFSPEMEQIRKRRHKIYIQLQKINSTTCVKKKEEAQYSGKENKISSACVSPAGADSERWSEAGRKAEFGEWTGCRIRFFQTDGPACTRYSGRGAASGAPPRQRHLHQR